MDIFGTTNPSNRFWLFKLPKASFFFPALPPFVANYLTYMGGKDLLGSWLTEMNNMQSGMMKASCTAFALCLIAPALAAVAPINRCMVPTPRGEIDHFTSRSPTCEVIRKAGYFDMVNHISFFNIQGRTFEFTIGCVSTVPDAMANQLYARCRGLSAPFEHFDNKRDCIVDVVNAVNYVNVSNVAVII